jgi:hypothetical protein
LLIEDNPKDKVEDENAQHSMQRIGGYGAAFWTSFKPANR